MKDKVVIITGSSRGLGYAIAKLFAKKGASVVINGRKADVLEEVKKDLNKTSDNVIAVKGDVSVENDVNEIMEKTLERFGRIDVLVNNAGLSLPKMLTETTLSEWEEVQKVNSNGVFLMCREVVKYMIKSKTKGRIVNVSSVAGKTGLAGACAYSASKGAVVALTKSLAKELAGFGINVNCVCPGGIETEMFLKGTLDVLAERFKTTRQKLLDSTLSVIPLKRLLKPEEVAELILYLSSKKADGITGQAYNISCGMEMG